MSDDMDVADVLCAAADWIGAHGLGKGEQTAKGPACAVGAIAIAEGIGTLWGGPASRELADLLGVGRVGGIFTWNDAPERTADEVITALLEAAARWREQNGGSNG
jgi:hypothetical protein